MEKMFERPCSAFPNAGMRVERSKISQGKARGFSLQPGGGLRGSKLGQQSFALTGLSSVLFGAVQLCGWGGRAHVTPAHGLAKALGWGLVPPTTLKAEGSVAACHVGEVAWDVLNAGTAFLHLPARHFLKGPSPHPPPS